MKGSTRKPGHEWAGQDIHLASLQSAPLLMREFGSGSRRVLEQALASAGLRPKDLAIGMEFDTTEGLLGAVEVGPDITFGSACAVRSRLAFGTLKLARVSGLSLARRFSITCAAGPAPVGNAAAFRVFLLTRDTGAGARGLLSPKLPKHASRYVQPQVGHSLASVSIPRSPARHPAC